MAMCWTWRDICFQGILVPVDPEADWTYQPAGGHCLSPTAADPPTSRRTPHRRLHARISSWKVIKD